MDFQALETHTTYNDYLKATFGGRTYKVVVASGLTCPTRDGTLAKRGCAFCDVRGSSSFHGKNGRGAEVTEQILSRITGIEERFKPEHFLAYFQSYTNTYGDLEYLREIYDAALSVPAMSGLCIGTRPDCLNDSVIQLLEEYAQKTYVSLELGVQSFEDPSLEWLTRGHDAKCSIDALERLERLAPQVHTCVHLMFGSPTDSAEAPQNAARILNRFKVRGAKLHQLMILQNTELAERYAETPFPVLTLDEYTRQVGDFLTHLEPRIYIERLYASATHPEECIAPDWSKERWRTHNEMRRILTQNGVKQGAALNTQ